MKSYTEKRTSGRKKEHTDIMYTFSQAKHYRGARLSNIGPGGLCFLANKYIEPGSDICIIKINYSQFDEPLEERDGYRAEVVWCNPVQDVYDSYYGKYSIGVQFVDIITGQG